MSDSRLEIVNILKENDDFLIASHYNPDGDALGSTAAMGFLCEALGKRFRLFNATGVPDALSWLPLPGDMLTSLSDLNGFTPGTFIIVDCGDPARVGKELHAALDPARTVNMDHHLGNPLFGAVNWVDPSKAAVGEMIALLAQDLDVPLTGSLGEAIYLALVTDTGNFSYANTRAETMEIGASILRHGLSPHEFTDKLQNQWTINRLQLWQDVLADVRFYCGGRIGVVRIPSLTLLQTGTTTEDCEGLVEFIRRVKDVSVAVALRENVNAPGGAVKFSLRSKGSTNVQQIARSLGGGGHRNAAGGQMDGPMDKAEDELVRAIVQGLDLGDHCLMEV
ncbi:MAG: bifunctional oligoribonuclease/PAP phosphatase NrnA [Desulfovibrionaceae bacterium]